MSEQEDQAEEQQHEDEGGGQDNLVCYLTPGRTVGTARCEPGQGPKSPEVRSRIHRSRGK